MLILSLIITFWQKKKSSRRFSIKKNKKAARMIKEKSVNCSETEDYHINLNNLLAALPLE